MPTRDTDAVRRPRKLMGTGQARLQGLLGRDQARAPWRVPSSIDQSAAKEIVEAFTKSFSAKEAKGVSQLLQASSGIACAPSGGPQAAYLKLLRCDYMMSITKVNKAYSPPIIRLLQYYLYSQQESPPEGLWPRKHNLAFTSTNSV